MRAIVVLAALFVLTVVFPIASQRSLAQLELTAVEKHLSKQATLGRDLLLVVVASDWTPADGPTANNAVTATRQSSVLVNVKVDTLPIEYSLLWLAIGILGDCATCLAH